MQTCYLCCAVWCAPSPHTAAESPRSLPWCPPFGRRRATPNSAASFSSPRHVDPSAAPSRSWLWWCGVMMILMMWCGDVDVMIWWCDVDVWMNEKKKKERTEKIKLRWIKKIRKKRKEWKKKSNKIKWKGKWRYVILQTKKWQWDKNKRIRSVIFASLSFKIWANFVLITDSSC